MSTLAQAMASCIKGTEANAHELYSEHVFGTYIYYLELLSHLPLANELNHFIRQYLKSDLWDLIKLRSGNIHRLQLGPSLYWSLHVYTKALAINIHWSLVHHRVISVILGSWHSATSDLVPTWVPIMETLTNAHYYPCVHYGAIMLPL